MQKDDRNPARDRELGMDRPINRRDFLNGMAIALGGVAASSLIPGFASATDQSNLAQNTPGYYPPKLTGMRGSHDGSFKIAHDLRDGKFWKNAGTPVDTRESYDLVVVGGGLSGLAAAYFYRAKNPAARILILDNHDDFGGHAKRNEFRSGGKLMLANGGTWAIESPFPYSKEAHGLMTDLGIDPAALEAKCHDRSVYRGLKSARFFDKETFGVDRLVTEEPPLQFGSPFSENIGISNANQKPRLSWTEFLAKTPLSEDARRDIARIEEDRVDYMPRLSQAEKKDRLSRMSYKDFLLNVVKVHADVLPFYQSETHGLYGVGIDAVPALDCWAIELPGFQGLNLDRVPGPRISFTALGFVTPEKSPYFFHFPDGNASIARMLVRSLIPSAVSGHTAEDVVTASVDYSKLDSPGSPIRIRLNSTAVGIKHIGDKASAKEVEVTYGSGTKAFTVRAKGSVLACWNMAIPYMCPELPDKQKEALHYGVKVPLVYTVVALRNWTSFQKIGTQRITCPGMYHSDIALDLAVD
ncbi:MAG TPA: NAD(P)-binding protein, partial [Terriglobales bacterium]|nr:NAD(P)-binding protein [Terriglobales bacterium]